MLIVAAFWEFVATFWGNVALKALMGEASRKPTPKPPSCPSQGSVVYGK